MSPPDARSTFRSLALVTAMTAGSIALAARGHAADAAQATVLRGRLHLIWDGGAGAEGAEYFVQPLDGRPATKLRVPRAIEESGRLLTLDRTEVEVTLTDVGGAAIRTAEGIPEASLVAIRGIGAAPNIVAPRAAAASASQAALDFVTVMCRFADDSRTPFSAGTLATVHGGSSPGLAFHYREMAQDPSVMGGSVIVGWYDLPLPRSSYVFPNGANYFQLAQDCASRAQGDVDFSQFAGVNLQLNGAMQTRPTPPYDTLSFGGSSSMTLNGVSRVWGVTWLSGIHASNYVVVHHEVGHAVGWPHSSGDYGQEYDSNWDIMSRGYLRLEAPWGWQGIHTIASHKDALGWLPPDRIMTPELGAVTKGRLVRSALPPPTGFLMVRVPLSDGSWLSAETRIPAGLDQPLPWPSVVMHRVKNGIRSYVVDPDQNGNPNDAAAQWIPGEEYSDPVSGVAIRVDSSVAFGFDITVTRGWRVEASIVGPGEVEVTAPGSDPVRCVSSCSNLLAVRDGLITLTAFPDPDRVFVGWKGACTGTGPCAFALSQNTFVTAEFAGQPAITTSELAPALMGGTYQDSLKVLIDGAPGTWTVSSGVLPAGLALIASTGRITGVPSEVGQFDFTLRVSAGPLFDEQASSIAVTKPVLVAEEVIASLLGGPSLGTTPNRFLDLLGNQNGRVDVGDVRAWLLENEALSPPQRAALLRALPRDGRSP